MNTELVVGTVVAQSTKVRHVLVQDARKVRYAVTRKTFLGDWNALRRGDVVELVVTQEPLPEVLNARLATAPLNPSN